MPEDLDLENMIHIEDTGTISLFVNNKQFYFPLLIFCYGYPKETRIAYELEQILGKDVIDRIAFTKFRYEVIDILNELPMDAATLYITVEREMEKEFQEKYMKYKFSGVNGPFEKMKKYDTIDYSSVYEIIDEYKRK